jgi:hypothetical protein
MLPPPLDRMNGGLLPLLVPFPYGWQDLGTIDVLDTKDGKPVFTITNSLQREIVL